MVLLQAMLIAMGIFFGTENDTQGSVNKNHANIKGQSNANKNAGFVAPEPGTGTGPIQVPSTGPQE